MMKKRLIKGRYGMVCALVLLSALTGCADSKRDDGTAAEAMAESTAEPMTEPVTVVDERAQTGTDEERISGEEDIAEKKEGDLESEDGARNAAYRSALEEVYARHLFPDGTDYGFDDDSDISDNHFAVYDIDRDGPITRGWPGTSGLIRCTSMMRRQIHMRRSAGWMPGTNHLQKGSWMIILSRMK